MSVKLSWNDAANVEQVVRAGTPLPANPAPIRLQSNIVEVVNLDAGKAITPVPNANTQHQVWCYVPLYSRRPMPRFVIPVLEMNFSANNASSHHISLSAGVWDTGTEAWISPVHRLVSTRRSTPFSQSEPGVVLTTLLPQGTANGQELPSTYINQFPIEIPETLYQVLESSGASAELRIFLTMRNVHASENITSPIRMWFTLLCF
jgi:hypothetical protein